MKILFINFGGLGDEILFLPTIEAVKKEFPNSQITLALEKRSSGIQSLTNIIDNILIANIKGSSKYIELFKLLIQIWRNKYDIVISSGSSKFISIFLYLTFIKKRYGYNTGKLSKLLLTQAVNLNKNQYAGLMYYDLVKSIVNKEFELPNLSIQKKPTIQNSVLIHPGVSKLSVQKGCIKTISPEVVNYAISSCGIKILGENRVQEYLSKKELYSPASVHFIGQLQTNKVKYIADKVSMIHSVESLKLAQEINKRAQQHDLTMDILIQVKLMIIVHTLQNLEGMHFVIV